jgi:hypothetical protein
MNANVERKLASVIRSQAIARRPNDTLAADH